ncbi:MAG: RsmD family RNA methyltransferase, partial [Flavobacteriales bacterium]
MRIIAGQFKGRLINVPKQFKGRPTTDFAREGI